MAVTVPYVNAVNLLDGLDGLAGAAATVSALGLAVLTADRGGTGTAGVVLAAVLVGFLVLNWPAGPRLPRRRRRLRGWAVLSLFHTSVVTSEQPLEIVIAVALLGVFLVDLAATVVRRIRMGERLFAGDRRHVYDQLCDRGWSVSVVVLTASVGQALIGELVMILDRAQGDLSAVIVLRLSGPALLALLGAGGFLSDRSPA